MADAAVLEKVTFSLPRDLVRRLREAVADGLFASQNALVREAVARELDRIREERLRAEFAEAARDPMFLQDIRDTDDAFASADAETARMIPDD